MSNPFTKKPAPSESEITTAVRVAIAGNLETDSLIEKLTPEILDPVEAESDDRIERGKLSRLVSDDFPFDDSQLAAIAGMIQEKYACLTGAAGTGKTTTTKKLVDELLNQSAVGQVNMKSYFRSEVADDGDDYKIPDSFIPAVAMVGFTGRSTQMIKKNFPRDWHGNIMTIHRLLAFAPVYFQAFDDESGEYRNKMRFEPQYTAENIMPWDIILIDEAGMVGLDLWHQLFAAMKPDCRIYMIGDINQLPPVHGRSIFGFAMDRWPAFELTHIHRQQGVNNEIVDNAWNVLQGRIPVHGGKFQMIKIDGEAGKASRQVRGIVPKIKDLGLFDPIRDTIITPINGTDGSRGQALGQLPLNQEFSIIFNPSSSHPRYVIDAGREKKYFAVGDKLMATKNDYDTGITNGMTGIITEIDEHPGYSGDRFRFGLIEEVNKYYESTGAYADDAPDDFTLEDLSESFDAIDEGMAEKKEKAERGPASHIVRIRFGTEENGFEIDFATLSEVYSLQTAYVVTCHKMQGGESPVVVIILHNAHKKMLSREWLYTAITRASEKCILLYTDEALRSAISKQRITGKTLKEKIKVFNLLQSNNGLGAAVNVTLPNAFNLIHGESYVRPDDDGANGTESRALVPSPAAELVTSRPSPDLGELAPAPDSQAQAQPEPLAPQPAKTRFNFKPKVTPIHVHVHIHQTAPAPEPTPERVTVKEVWPVEEAPFVVMPPRPDDELADSLEAPTPILLLPAPALRPRWSADSLEYPPGTHENDNLWTVAEESKTEAVAEVVPEKPKNPWARRLGVGA